MKKVPRNFLVRHRTYLVLASARLFNKQKNIQKKKKNDGDELSRR
jgi:hypothetical protein